MEIKATIYPSVSAIKSVPFGQSANKRPGKKSWTSLSVNTMAYDSVNFDKTPFILLLDHKIESNLIRH